MLTSVPRYDTQKAQDGVGGEEGESTLGLPALSRALERTHTIEGAFSLTTLWTVEALGRAGAYDPSMLEKAVSMFEVCANGQSM